MKGQQDRSWLYWDSVVLTAGKHNSIMIISRVQNHVLRFIITLDIIVSHLHCTQQVVLHRWHQNHLVNFQHVNLSSAWMVISYHTTDCPAETSGSHHSIIPWTQTGVLWSMVTRAVPLPTTLVSACELGLDLCLTSTPVTRDLR